MFLGVKHKLNPPDDFNYLKRYRYKINNDKVIGFCNFNNAEQLYRMVWYFFNKFKKNEFKIFCNDDEYVLKFDIGKSLKLDEKIDLIREEFNKIVGKHILYPHIECWAV